MSDLSHMAVVAQLRAPLCLARRPTAPGQPIETLDYITGTALRGGLANAWLQGRRPDKLPAPEQDLFHTLFTSGAVVFGNCLPAGDADATMVIPRSAETEKRGGGWLNDERARFGVVDVLKHRLCDIDPLDAFHQRYPDRTDLETLDRLGQTFAGTEADSSRPRKLVVRRRQITRTAVDPVRGSARARQLYSFEALETGEQFRGMLIGPAQLLDQLRALVQAPHDTLWMGQGRTRGLGEVFISDVGAAQPFGRDRAQAIADVLRFNQQLRALTHDGRLPVDQDVPEEDVVYLPVTLEADVLLRDHYLLPSSDPTPIVTLGRYLNLPAPLATAMRVVPRGCLLSTGWIGGWDEMRGLPRTPLLATSMGSVWTFTVPEQLLEPAVDWWLEAERFGLGERRSEGYGRVRLGHPLHLTEEPQ